MRSTNQDDAQGNVDQRMRTMFTLWIALFISIGLYYAFSLVKGRPEGLDPESTLPLPWIAVALSTVLISFLIKSKLISQAVDQQRVQLVQQAYIVAWAITETAALVGLLLFFLNGNRFYYVLFLIAAAGMLLHFPRREHVLNASSRRSVT
jgi:hypothetical protein